MSWGALALGLALGGAWLLVGAGVAKARDRWGTLGAIRTLVPWAPSWSVPVVGVSEISLGVAFLAFPSAVTATLLGGWFAALFVVALLLRRRRVDCGCFGASSAPVTGAHLAVCAGAIVAALGWVLAPPGGPVPLIAAAVGEVLALGVAVVAYSFLGPLPMLRRTLEGIHS